MEKLLKVSRLRFTDQQFVDIQRFMALDGRERFEETVRHLVDIGLKTKMRMLGKMQGVEGCETGEQSGSYSGPDRRRSSRGNTR